MSKISKEIVEAVLETPSFLKTIQVDPNPPVNLSTWLKILIYLRIKSKPLKQKSTFDLYLKPANLKTVYAISGLLSEVNDLQKSAISEHSLIDSTGPLLSKAIAIAIHNNQGIAPEWLVEAIEDQFNPKELREAAIEVYRRLDYESFFGTMVSLRLINQIDTPETEAPGL